MFATFGMLGMLLGLIAYPFVLRKHTADLDWKEWTLLGWFCASLALLLISILQLAWKYLP